MDLPKNYIVSCKTQKETNDVLEKIHPVKRGGDYWLHWEFICFSEEDENSIDIFHTEEYAKDWFKSKDINDYDILTFSEWEDLYEKPYTSTGDITYHLLTTHPYFRKMNREQLIYIIDHMNYSGYMKIEGEGMDEKLKTILKMFNNKETMQKLIVPITDVLKIHKIACSEWKVKITNYLTRVDENQNIKFSQSEVDEMFKAATSDQKPVLTKIFGELVKPIDWGKIKAGSKVMLKHTDQFCNGCWDDTRPVEVVFYNTPHCINDEKKFFKTSFHNSYCTFYQDGEFILFGSNKNQDYIVEVIEY